METSSQSGIGPLIWFFAIIVLIPLVLWLVRRTPVGAAHSAAGLRTLCSLPMGTGQRLVVVEVGQGPQRQTVLLGQTPQAISMLTELHPDVAEQLARMPAGSILGGAEGAAGAFAKLLRQRRDGS